MPMSFGGISKQKVATVIVAADGTGDTTDIQTGINLLPATGGVVYIKEGTYTITTTITIAIDNVALIGAGKATKILTTSTIDMISATSRSGLLINDLWIYGNRVAGNDGIIFTSCTNSIIRNVWVENCAPCVQLTSTNCVVEGCYIDNSLGWGIHGTNSSNIRIINNKVTAGPAEGIEFEDSTGIIISNNMTISNSYAGIRLIRCHDCVISNNICTGSGRGITLFEDCDDNVLNNNRCTGNTTGIEITAATGQRNIIVGNALNGNTTAIADSGSGTQIGHNIE